MSFLFFILVLVMHFLVVSRLFQVFGGEREGGDETVLVTVNPEKIA